MNAKDARSDNIMSSYGASTTAMSSLKKTPKKSQLPYPSDYRSLAEPKSMPSPLASHPPAVLPARQVSSTEEYKATPSSSSNHLLSPPPKIPGPAKAPAGRGYEHQRRAPPSMSTAPSFPNPSAEMRAAPAMMRTGGAQRAPPFMSPPEALGLNPRSVPKNANVGPKARGMEGRRLFRGEEVELERLKAEMKADEEEKKKKLKEEVERYKKKKKEAAQKRIADEAKSNAENEFEQHPGFTPTVGMDTAKMRFGRPRPGPNPNAIAKDKRPFAVKPGHKPPPPPGRPKAKGAAPSVPPPQHSRPPPGTLTARRAAGQKPDECLNGGWWRFTDPSTGYQYFWNELTSVSQYERPVNFDTNAGDAFRTARAQAAAKEEARMQLKHNDGWERHVDPDTNMHYFYKEATDEGQWERPSNFSTVKGGFTAAMFTSRRDPNQLPVELMDGSWVKYVDPETGYPYYYNPGHDVSTFERPPNLETRQDPFADARGDGGEDMVPAGILYVRRDEEQLPVEKLNGGWVKYVDYESGHPYYYHEESDESQYERPEGFATVADPFASARSSASAVSSSNPIPAPPEVLTARRDPNQLPVEKLNSGWQKFVDPDSGYPYYFNEVTQNSQYERPEGFETKQDPFASMRSSSSAQSGVPGLISAQPSARSVSGLVSAQPSARSVKGLVSAQPSARSMASRSGLLSAQASARYQIPESAKDIVAEFTKAIDDTPAGILNVRRDEDQLPVEILNGGWEKHIDHESGHPYYYHEGRDESQYERPDGFATVSDPFASVKSNSTSTMPPAEVLTARNPNQQPAEILNNGWKKYVDPESGWPYYVNDETSESTYERPDGFTTVADPFNAARTNGAMPPAEVLTARRTSRDTARSRNGKKEDPVETLNGGWEKYQDPDSGHFYYHHAAKDISQYERPEDFLSTVKGTMPSADALSSRRSVNDKPVEVLNNSGWQKYIDPESGHPYYYHEASEASQYERPDGFSTAADPFASTRSTSVMPPASNLSARRGKRQKPQQVLNNGWVRYVDPESNYPYYYNEGLDLSQYERPEGFETSANPFGTVRMRAAPPTLGGIGEGSEEGGDAMDAMMATFASKQSSSLARVGEESPWKGGHGNNTRGFGRAGKAVLADTLDFANKVNDKLSKLSLDELKQMQQGDGLMSTLRQQQHQQLDDHSAANPSSSISIPQLNFTGFLSGNVNGSGSAATEAPPNYNYNSQASAGDALDGLVGGSSIQTEKSWLEIADDAEGSSILVAAAASTDISVDASAWEQYFDDEVGANYWYNTVSGEASWVRPEGV